LNYITYRQTSSYKLTEGRKCSTSFQIKVCFVQSQILEV